MSEQRMDGAALNGDQLTQALAAELVASLNRFAGTLVAQRQQFLEQHRLIDVTGAATLLGVSEQWVRRRTADGLIPCIKLGALARYHPPTLIEWALSRQEVPDEPSR